jgi:nucleoid DNA-binding protein
MPEVTALPPGTLDEELQAFVDEVRAVLQHGDRHSTPGFGTFSTCTRKAAPGRPACTMAMFRASKQLRAHVSDGAEAQVSGAHTPVVRAIIAAMQRAPGVDVPRLGHLGLVPVRGKKPRLIFHADPEFNGTLTVTAGKHPT